MAKLKITRANGEVTEHKITPGVEYAFELKYQPIFGAEFIDSLETVEVLDEEKK